MRRPIRATPGYRWPSGAYGMQANWWWPPAVWRRFNHERNLRKKAEAALLNRVG